MRKKQYFVYQPRHHTSLLWKRVVWEEIEISTRKTIINVVAENIPLIEARIKIQSYGSSFAGLFADSRPYAANFPPLHPPSNNSSTPSFFPILFNRFAPLDSLAVQEDHHHHYTLSSFPFFASTAQGKAFFSPSLSSFTSINRVFHFGTRSAPFSRCKVASSTFNSQ